LAIGASNAKSLRASKFNLKFHFYLIEPKCVIIL
jgi:hypothetical protein